jgi:hypothetical protein
VIDFQADKWTLESSIDTSNHCRAIVCYKDSAEEPCTVINKNADVRIDIYGTPEYIKDRMIELHSKYDARCRSFPTRVKTDRISELDGIQESFNKYTGSFSPPNRTAINLLVDEVKNRLHGL